MPLPAQYYLRYALGSVREKLLAASGDDPRLTMWRSERWYANRPALAAELEELHEEDLLPPTLALVRDAGTLLLLLDGTNKQLSTVLRVAPLLRIARRTVQAEI